MWSISPRKANQQAKYQIQRKHDAIMTTKNYNEDEDEDEDEATNKDVQEIARSRKSTEEQTQAEEEIREKQKVVDYDTKEYPVEVIVKKYLDGIKEEQNELFIPDYQREMAWNLKRMSRFVESIFLGLPIPYIFVADISSNEGESKEGRLEIVDGTQRIRTLAEFVSNNFALQDLDKLKKSNGFYFSDFTPARQRRFNRRTIRMIELTEKADEEVRRDMFERINTGSVELTDMEKRRGIHPGPMLELLEECASIDKFAQLAPMSEVAVKRRDRQELVLRFFAYFENYEGFDRQVNEFLDEYLKKKNQEGINKEDMKNRFITMLNFVETYFPAGFKKKANHKSTPRIRFESIAVGSALALQINPQLVPKDVSYWIESPHFKILTTTDSSNNRKRIIQRIEYVRDCLLERD